MEIYDVKYDCDNYTYYVKEKHNGQTYEIGMQLEYGNDTIFANVYARVSTKRKHQGWNEDNLISTGRSPLYTMALFRHALQLLERKVMRMEVDPYDSCKKLVVCVFWTDNRRRDAYHRVLSKQGYNFNRFEGKKCLMKVINRGDEI